MAGRKLNEIDFILNAQMNSGFHGTFTKAQAEFAKLGGEIAELHKAQSNVAAYQKQQGAIAATEDKLANLKKQHALLQTEIDETTGSTASLSREKLKLEQRIKNAEDALTRQKQKLGTTAEALKGAEISTDDLGEAQTRLSAQLAELTAQQEQAAKGALTFGEKTAQSFGAVQSAIAAAGVAAALHEIGGAYMDCITIAGDFQSSMSTVEALSGATANEMESLTAKAKEMGAATKFTAQEASEAMQYMSMAGWDAASMTAGLNGVMQLAAASGEELGTVSDIVTDALTAFGMTAQDTNRFVDILAAAATKSNTNVSMLGESFKYAAPLCGTLGYSAQDAAVALGLMANSGIKSSQAGTTLKTALANLSAPTKAQAGEMERLGISMTNADGTMKSLAQLTDSLRSSFSELSEAEQTAADVDSLTQSIYGSAGAAQRMAEIKLNNMNGQLVLMKSAWDALKTSVGEQFTPAMRDLYKVGTDVFTGVDQFVQDSPGVVGAVTGVVGSVAALTAGITAYTAVTKVAKALDLAAMFTGPAGIILGVGAAVGALGGAIYGMYQRAHEGVPEVEELTRAASDLGETAQQAGLSIGLVATETQAGIDTANLYISRLKEIEAATGGNVAGNEDYRNTLTLLTQVMPELAGQIDLTTNSIEGGTAALEASIAAMQKNAEEQARTDKLTDLLSKQAAAEQELAKNKLDRTAAEIRLTEIEKQREPLEERLKELSWEASRNGTDLTAEYYEQAERLKELKLEQKQTQNALKNLNTAIEQGETAALSAQDALRDYNAVLAEQAGVSQEAAGQINLLTGVIDNTASHVQLLVDAYNESYAAALESVEGQYAVWDKAAAVSATSAANMASNIEGQRQYWEDYAANMNLLLGKTSEIEGLGAMLASFADGSADSVNAIAGLADAVNAGDTDTVAEMAEQWQALQEAQSEAAQSIADLQTGFSSEMDAIQNRLAEHIAAMDLGDEALKSGQATIQGYLDAAEGMLPQVREAYGRLGSAAAAALSGGGGSVSVTPQNAYASGTQSAEPGFALVGEEGPELAWFNGGEKVMDAGQTASMRAQPALSALVAPVTGSESGSPVSIQISFNIQGNATPETVASLQEFGDDFAQRVQDVVSGMLADRERRRMA